MRPSIKIALAVFIGLSAMGLNVLWDLYFGKKLESAEVLVVKAGEEIGKKEMITRDKIAVELRDKKDLVEGVIYAQDYSKVVGKDAGQLLIGNSMISESMIDWDELVPDPDKDEAIRPIPTDWIYAKPGSLRRKDRVDIYLVPNSLTKDETQDLIEEGTVREVKDDEEKVTEDKETAPQLKPILENIPVVYAKDGANNEVVGVKPEGQADDKRLNATGQITELELLLTNEQFYTLYDSVLYKKSKLYITYN